MKLTLEEASVYLNSKSYREIDSLVKSHCYSFSYDLAQDLPNVYISIYPSKYTGTGIQGYFNNSFEGENNFETVIKYGQQTKSKY